jgi:UDP-2-acetamido-2,6-beta-L-arabino-hexul-4-ose reductase
MKLNVLVTGANGFFGKAMIGRLKKSNVNILTFTRENNSQDLQDLVLRSDFIYHFAGEVKAGLSSIKYERSNSALTQNILDILESKNKNTPILFTSSIHSDVSVSSYGKTKKKSEEMIEKYANRNSTRCYIYKLPHVFGQECKPNHNSVITTWMYNSINHIDIDVYDKEIKMNYIYIQDIVGEFAELLTVTQDTLYLKPQLIYPTTLGDVLEYIEEFKVNVNKTDYVIVDNEFKSKLYATYQSYFSDIKNEPT